MRDSVRDVLAESSEGIMQESLHLVVLLRRAMGEVSEKEAQVREFRDRAEVAEKRLSAASESANKWKEEAEASTLARSEALQRLEDEEARRCQAEHDHSQAAAKLEVAMNWARAEEEKRVEAEARVKHLEQSLDAAMTQQQELQATLHDKDLAVQKLCLEQEGLDNKCAELVKEVQSYSLQLEAKQKEVLRLQTYIQQVEAEIDEYKALLSKNEKRTILLLDQLKRLSEENVNLVRRASELGREDGPESSNRSRRFVTSHLKAGATQDVNTRPGRVTVLESELIKAEARSNELEGRLQQEVKHRGAAEQKYQEMALSLEAVQARLKQSEEIAHARDQAMKAMHLALNQSRSNQETHTHNTPTRPPYPHHHTTRDPFLDSTASAPPSTSLPPPPVRQNRPPSAATKYFSILSDPPFARSV